MKITPIDPLAAISVPRAERRLWLKTGFVGDGHIRGYNSDYKWEK